jgi:hypothetical protein
MFYIPPIWYKYIKAHPAEYHIFEHQAFFSPSSKSKYPLKPLRSIYNDIYFNMKVTALLSTLMVMATVNAAAQDNPTVQDVCGSGYGVDQRRTNSGCQASNGDRHFCGCDRTGVVRLSYPG